MSLSRCKNLLQLAKDFLGTVYPSMDIPLCRPWENRRQENLPAKTMAESYPRITMVIMPDGREGIPANSYYENLGGKNDTMTVSTASKEQIDIYLHWNTLNYQEEVLKEEGIFRKAAWRINKGGLHRELLR